MTKQKDSVPFEPDADGIKIDPTFVEKLYAEDAAKAGEFVLLQQYKGFNIARSRNSLRFYGLKDGKPVTRAFATATDVGVALDRLAEAAKRMGKAVEEKEFWFQSEAGIRGYHAEQREAEAARSRDAMKRINDAELEFLEALKKSRGKA